MGDVSAEAPCSEFHKLLYLSSRIVGKSAGIYRQEVVELEKSVATMR
jgi:hypothetical protein